MINTSTPSGVVNKLLRLPFACIIGLHLSYGRGQPWILVCDKQVVEGEEKSPGLCGEMTTLLSRSILQETLLPSKPSVAISACMLALSRSPAKTPKMLPP